MVFINEFFFSISANVKPLIGIRIPRENRAIVSEFSVPIILDVSKFRVKPVKTKIMEDPVRDDANVLALSSFKGLKQDLVRFLETIILFHHIFFLVNYCDAIKKTSMEMSAEPRLALSNFDNCE